MSRYIDELQDELDEIDADLSRVRAELTALYALPDDLTPAQDERASFLTGREATLEKYAVGVRGDLEYEGEGEAMHQARLDRAYGEWATR